MKVGMSLSLTQPYPRQTGSGPLQITSGTAFSVDENQTPITTITAAGGQAPYTFSINGGNDAAFVEINAATGVLAFITPRDYELPEDAGQDNVYDVTVQCVDNNGLVAEKAMSIQIIQQLSFAGSETEQSVDENTTVIDTYTAVGGFPPYEYSIVGGDDAAKFSINASTGDLIWSVTPDYENPTDTDSDNVYEVVIRVTDSESNSAGLSIAVTVNDVADDPLTITTTISSGIYENSLSKDIVSLAASGGDGSPYSWGLISTGAGPGDSEDISKFSVDLTSGLLSFADFTDFEEPADYDHDNVYKVRIGCTAGEDSTYANFVITVTDDPLSHISSPATFDIEENTLGTIFEASTLFNPGGRYTYLFAN